VHIGELGNTPELHDLPYHGKQFTVTVNLPETVPVSASVLPEHVADSSFRNPLLPQGLLDGFHRPAATLVGRYQEQSCAPKVYGRLAKHANNPLCTLPFLQPRTLSSLTRGSTHPSQALAQHLGRVPLSTTPATLSAQ
jgi:hypothetical protein